MRALSLLLAGLGACGYVAVEAVTDDACSRCSSVMDASTASLDARVQTFEASFDARVDASRDAGVEVCDGVDNDGDGVIDNVDVAGDGVCDCLTLATLGMHGRYGAGDVLAGWLEARSDIGATNLDGVLLTAELLARYRVIVLQDLRYLLFAPEEFVALDAWVRAGGGLFATTGYAKAAERANVNTILAPTGIQYDDAAVLSSDVGTVAITGWRAHPVSDGIRALGIDNGYAVVGGGTIVAEQAGVVALRAAVHGDGRVLAWGDAWFTYDSEWKAHPAYQVERFWLNVIKWLSPPRDCQVAIPTYL